MEHLTLTIMMAIVLFVCFLFLIRHAHTMRNKTYKEFLKDRKSMRHPLSPDWDAVKKAQEIAAKAKATQTKTTLER